MSDMGNVKRALYKLTYCDSELKTALIAMCGTETVDVKVSAWCPV